MREEWNDHAGELHRQKMISIGPGVDAIVALRVDVADRRRHEAFGQLHGATAILRYRVDDVEVAALVEYRVQEGDVGCCDSFLLKVAMSGPESRSNRFMRYGGRLRSPRQFAGR